MANKHQVLELLEKGLNPQEVARELGCSDAYVRAVRKRAENPDYFKQFASYTRSHEKYAARLRNNPEARRKHNETQLRSYHRRKAENRI